MSDRIVERQRIWLMRWLDALRSGKYKKVKGALHAEGRFCAYGVLCDIAVGEVGGKWQPSDSHDDEFSFVIAGECPEDKMPPKAVLQLVGLYGEVFPVDEWNDGGYSFKRIADRIEKKHPLLTGK